MDKQNITVKKILKHSPFFIQQHEFFVVIHLKTFYNQLNLLELKKRLSQCTEGYSLKLQTLYK